MTDKIKVLTICRNCKQSLIGNLTNCTICQSDKVINLTGDYCAQIIIDEFAVDIQEDTDSEDYDSTVGC